MKIGIVAGEASGDRLGASLMESVLRIREDVEFLGIGGTQMLEQGLQPLASMDRFSMNGFVEPLRKLPDLFKLLQLLVSGFREVDVVVGVDFNVFNFILEKRMKKLGVRTVHYVSPSVYAWRRGRIKRIDQSANVLLTLFPFEPSFYKESQVNAVFVGHPLADEINPDDDRSSVRKHAREVLNVDEQGTVIALLPGSRNSEIRFHANLFFSAADRIRTLLSEEDCVFVVPCSSDRAERNLNAVASRYPQLELDITRCSSRTVFEASDAALVKSGTSTLEALLFRVPMAVAYRAGPITYAIVKSMLHTEWIALPNILMGRTFVPEFLQQSASSETLAVALHGELLRSRTEDDYFVEYERLHLDLRRDASTRAAEMVLNAADSKVET